MENGVLRVAYGLYPHQRDVVAGLLDYLDASRASGLSPADRRVVAHLPTGAGKTRVASHVVGHLLNSGPRDERGLVIWLVQRCGAVRAGVRRIVFGMVSPGTMGCWLVSLLGG